jgi:hypothetical protein
MFNRIAAAFRPSVVTSSRGTEILRGNVGGLPAGLSQGLSKGFANVPQSFDASALVSKGAVSNGQN